jgi:SAM-dependent methyltransferase
VRAEPLLRRAHAIGGGLLASRPRLARHVHRVRRPLRLAMLRGAPVSTTWGFERGTPVDRYYIEAFLRRNASDMRGRVLEVQDDTYVRRYGRGVEHVDVLDIDESNTVATIHADLSDAREIPDMTFDCFVLTQTLHVIYEIEAAVRHAHRILRPGGVLLATVPVLSPLRGDPDAPVDFWRVTPGGCARLFGDVFGGKHVEVEAHGNLTVAFAFLSGAAHEELSPRQLERRDTRHPVLCTVRAVRPT